MQVLLPNYSLFLGRQQPQKVEYGCIKAVY